MSDTRNALNELADALDMFTELSFDEQIEVSEKAKKIIRELAKVKDIKEFGVVHIREDMAIDAIENCRIIAAEGAKE